MIKSKWDKKVLQKRRVTLACCVARGKCGCVDTSRHQRARSHQPRLTQLGMR